MEKEQKKAHYNAGGAGGRLFIAHTTSIRYVTFVQDHDTDVD